MGQPISRSGPVKDLISQTSRERHEVFQATELPAPLSLAGLRILLADDSLDNQILFSRVLEMAGAELQIASNGAEAVALSGEFAFDAIIMDMRMPIVDGYMATSEIRRAGFAGPVIALTAHANPGEEERCRAAGCSHFFLKPISRGALLAAVFSAFYGSAAPQSPSRSRG